jgi:hypothetical protein
MKLLPWVVFERFWFSQEAYIVCFGLGSGFGKTGPANHPRPMRQYDTATRPSKPDRLHSAAVAHIVSQLVSPVSAL